MVYFLKGKGQLNSKEKVYYSYISKPVSYTQIRGLNISVLAFV